MITDEDKKAEIIEKLTIESCDKLIRHLLDKILTKAHRDNWSVSIDVKAIGHYLDCINIIRENEKLIKAYPPK